MVWDNLTEQQKLHRSQIGKKAWEQKSEIEKENLILQSQEAVRESSRKGSKLEHFLLGELSKANIKVEFHKEHWLQNQNLQIDLYLPTYRVAIEVDGPSHFKPVWGQDNLARNIKADQQKTGLLLSNGFVLIRVKQQKGLSEKYKREILSKIVSILTDINKKYPSRENRYIEIGD